MPKPSVAWFDSLTDSVFALGAAARECRAASEAARIASWHIDPVRLNPVDGELKVTGSGCTVRPHDQAIWRIHDLCLYQEHRTKALFENTAQAYAYGTAAVLLSVLKGERPRFVELKRTDTGEYVITGGLLPDLRNRLGSYVGSSRLAVLRDDVIGREHAAGVAADLASQDYLADHEAGEMADASDFAAGLADSYCAYGAAAESALHFALIAAKSHAPKEEGQ
ncbi:hypothetical protein QCN29_05040 [Streptomyces sp. HNM0663]|uniref:Uncharacterized protein n=1 Tax=Streptomyces chengmaiensis TaxID=3040919 RepID=A0ABT6HJC9_9ACTN|nr:hypothetical protein [Streptomyces chengmaiensis]MDH2388164.1 hypothetical protein [Streptomyces chengmaiensis]